MIKLVALVNKKSGLSIEQFRDYWIDIHAPLARQIPGMRGYRINVGSDPGELTPAPYDGSAEIWFDDRQTMDAGLSSPQGDIAGAETSNFADSIVFLVCEEHVVIDQSPVGTAA
ncbi:EthD family reductase [Bauldia sp.]|uniref:EthD family reductase n=1 Tax=Bauldia sp. TaxID=2575872 RepID=UPI003BAB5308